MFQCACYSVRLYIFESSVQYGLPNPCLDHIDKWIRLGHTVWLVFFLKVNLRLRGHRWKADIHLRHFPTHHTWWHRCQIEFWSKRTSPEVLKLTMKFNDVYQIWNLNSVTVAKLPHLVTLSLVLLDRILKSSDFEFSFDCTIIEYQLMSTLKDMAIIV